MTVEHTPFRGDRLMLARAFRHWTQGDLGERIAASPTLVSLVENGHRTPTDDFVEAAADALGFTPSFFFLESVDPFHDAACSFRKRATTSERRKKQVLASATLLADLVAALKEKVAFPPVKLPALVASTPEEVERAALRVRSEWGVGQSSPVDSMVNTLENAGIVVLTLDEVRPDVDAFTRFGGATPFVVVSSAKGSTSRTRWDIGHELGHLVLHSHQRPLAPRVAEEQAHRFAAGFLLPATGFGAEFASAFDPTDLAGLLRLKVRWKVSVAAMVHRARELGLISAAWYRRSFMRLSALGWRKAEPTEPTPEEPSLIASALQMADADQPGYLVAVADRLGWLPSTFTELTGVPLLPMGRSVIPIRGDSSR